MKTSNKLLASSAVGAAGIAAFWWIRQRSIQTHPVGNPNVPEPRKRVDLDRYLGVWHEVARYDQGFERGCSGATARYARLPDGKISIENTCIQADGKRSGATGRAKIVDENTNAKLKVSFFGPFYTGDYWVLDHADDYSWSIVGEPSGRALWLLAREASPDGAFVDRLFDRARDLGYDTSMLIRSAGAPSTTA